MGHHSHDGIDWDAHVQRLRDSDQLLAPEHRDLARNLLRENDNSVLEIGSGAGGASAAFAELLEERRGTVTVVDSAPELLATASQRVRETAPHVSVRSVCADAASDALLEVEPADLVYASLVVHHFPDQLDGLRRLVQLVKPGGRLAVVETGLPMRVLPADVGIGSPGLESRLLAAREEGFHEMRANMVGSVRLPMGWSEALAEAGLTEVRSLSQLVERSAPLSPVARLAIVRRLEWLREGALDDSGQPSGGSAEDVAALDQLLDPSSTHYVGHRSDVFILGVDTVYLGLRAG